MPRGELFVAPAVEESYLNGDLERGGGPSAFVWAAGGWSRGDDRPLLFNGQSRGVISPSVAGLEG